MPNVAVSPFPLIPRSRVNRRPGKSHQVVQICIFQSAGKRVGRRRVVLRFEEEIQMFALSRELKFGVRVHERGESPPLP